jgi:septation ring formation regulator EzrA
MEDVRQDKENVAALERELTFLQHNHRLDGGTPLSVHKYKTGDFFEHAKEIGAMFKQLRLPREDRERLWQNFQSLCAEVRSIQEEFRNSSSRNSELLESRLNDAFHVADGANDRESMQSAAAEKEKILSLFKQYNLTKPDRERCWNLFTRLCDRIRSNRSKLQFGDYLEAKKLADDCLNTASYGNPHEALKEIKDARATIRDLYMDKGQRESVRNELNKAWDEAIAKIEETKAEKQKAHQEWTKRMEGNIERWERNIEKAEDSIQRIESHLDDLREQESSAWNDDFADRVRGWISEAEQQIEDRRESIRTWQDKIDDAKSKLRG